MRKIIGATLLALGTICTFSGVASAHDVTPDNGSQCTSPTTGEVKFVAANMGNEQRDIAVFLGAVKVGEVLNFTGNGSVKVNITVPQQPPQDIAFTWTTDAVAHGPSTILIDWSKPKCQPVVDTTIPTTTPTTLPTTTTTVCVEEDENGRPCVTTTTTATTLPTTTTLATTTTVPTTSSSIPFCVPNTGVQCLNIDPTTTTVAQSTTTTLPAATTVPEPSTTAPNRAVAPPSEPSEPTVSISEEPEDLPVTGNNSLGVAVIGILSIIGGAVLLGASKGRLNGLFIRGLRR